MKETSFIDQNKEKWTRFEKLYSSKSKDPEELSDLYMDITDDLSYAQTFYKRRTVRVYLNQLAQTVFSGVHKQKGESIKKFLSVWRVSLPLEIYRSRKNLLFALICFIIYAAIGAVTTHFDNDFPRQVMGDGYVDMTIQNIAEGKPLNVYSGAENFKGNMFYDITTNNIKVAFLTFFLGFFFTIGTHIIMFSNGVMLGSFQYFFHTKGLLITSFLGIWIHGAFEISAIVIAAGAGITAGNGWLFPKSYSRLQSLQMSTRRGLKIMLSLVPFLILAGFLESYVTRNNQTLSETTKWFLIFFCFAIILFVYVLYPIYVARKYPELVDQEDIHEFAETQQITFTRIKTVGEIISDGFYLYRKSFAKVLKFNLYITLPLILVFIAYRAGLHPDEMNEIHWFDWHAQLEIMIGFNFQDGSDYMAAFYWTIIFSLIVSSSFYALLKIKNSNTVRYFHYLKTHFLRIWASLFIICALFYLVPYTFHIFLLFLFPLIWGNIAFAGLQENYKWSFKSFLRFDSSSYGSTLLIILFLYLLVFLASQPIAFVASISDPQSQPPMNDLLDLLSQFIQRVAKIYYENPIAISNFVRQIVYVFFLMCVLPMVCFLLGTQFYSNLEKNEAVGLHEAFRNFGKRSRTNEKDADYE